MRVLHVVTLASETGAFGGPLRVALNQVAELRRRGHDALIVGGSDERGTPVDQIDGVSVRLFPVIQTIPGAGFSGLTSRALRRWLKTEAAGFDLVHVHAGRDLIAQTALSTVRGLGVPYVVQTHGMIRLDERLRARVLDRLLVRRNLLAAERVLVLMDEEVVDLPLVVGRRLPLHRVRNGVELPDGRASGTREVLYCARLHSRKRPLAFVEMAAMLRDRGVDASFTMLGPDEGELAAVRRRIDKLDLESVVSYEGALPYDAVLERMRAAAVYVLPSVDEPFPMSLLEALSLGLASVCTDSCGISDDLSAADAARVTDGSPSQMALVVQALLEDDAAREALGQRGRDSVRDLFSIERVVDDLETVYGTALSPGARRQSQ